MSRTWGVWSVNDRTHVAPSKEDGRILPPHELDELCPCMPELNEDGDLIHNEIQ